MEKFELKPTSSSPEFPLNGLTFAVKDMSVSSIQFFFLVSFALPLRRVSYFSITLLLFIYWVWFGIGFELN